MKLLNFPVITELTNGCAGAISISNVDLFSSHDSMNLKDLKVVFLSIPYIPGREVVCEPCVVAPG